MISHFARLDVSGWPFVRSETIGQSPAVWLRNPDGDYTTNHHWLFKPVEVHSNGSEQGGDWAEKAASEIAKLLDIPAAEVELASYNGTRGSISRNVKPEFWDMWSGRLWLDANTEITYSSAEASKSKRKKGASKGYSLTNIHKSLVPMGPPPGHSGSSSMTGFGVFCSYLLLDALIANRDRHEDNWAVLVETIGEPNPHLCPAFDHAGSLGYQLTDPGRQKMLDAEGGVNRWVLGGTAWRFEATQDDKPESLVDLAWRAAKLAGVPTELALAARLDLLTPATIDAIFDCLEEMSVAARTFAIAVTLTNAERIRDGYRNIST